MGGAIPLLTLYAFMVCTEKTRTSYQMYDGDKPSATHQIVATINEAAIFYIRNKFGDKNLQNLIAKGFAACKQANGDMLN
jgi:hypothetical protein